MASSGCRVLRGEACITRCYHSCHMHSCPTSENQFNYLFMSLFFVGIRTDGCKSHFFISQGEGVTHLISLWNQEIWLENMILNVFHYIFFFMLSFLCLQKVWQGNKHFQQPVSLPVTNPPGCFQTWSAKQKTAQAYLCWELQGNETVCIKGHVFFTIHMYTTRVAVW